MKVVDISVNGTEFHPGDYLQVEARIQKDYFDLGPYDLAMYIRPKRGSAQDWQRVAHTTGSIGLITGQATIPMPSVPVPTAAGEYYVGVLDTGNIGSTQGATVDEVLRNTATYRAFTVTMPPPTNKGQLNVYAYPEDAEIYINDVYVGSRSVVGHNVAPGVYKITAKKFLYSTDTATVSVPVGEVVAVELALTPIVTTQMIAVALLGIGAIAILGTGIYVVTRSAKSSSSQYSTKSAKPTPAPSSQIMWM